MNPKRIEAFNRLQCGRIYKDAEIEKTATLTAGDDLSFNVAASIKMRKYEAAKLLADAENIPSMWPHL